MKRRQMWLAVAMLGGACLSLSGCLVGADVLNPSLLPQLGIDPKTIRPQNGIVVVAFNNQTNQDVQFLYYTALDANDLTDGVDLFTETVAPGETNSKALFCPFALFSLGSVGQNGAVTTVGANLGGTQVQYTGSQLRSGSEFVCGDVIEVSLITTATGDQQNQQATFRIRVIPGR